MKAKLNRCPHCNAYLCVERTITTTSEFRVNGSVDEPRCSKDDIGYEDDKVICETCGAEFDIAWTDDDRNKIKGLIEL